MKRVRVRPVKVVQVNRELAAKVADASQRVGLTKAEAEEIIRAFPRGMPTVIVGSNWIKPSRRRTVVTAKVLGKVRRMLEESGDQSRQGSYDLERWVEVWLQTRLPELQGKTPAETMQTHDGWERVEAILERMRDGGFS